VNNAPAPNVPVSAPKTIKGIEQEAGVRFTVPREGLKLIVVDTARVDAELARDPRYHVGPGGIGASAKPGAYANVRTFVETAKIRKTAVEAPRLSLAADGGLTIPDGRHRWAYFRDSGLAHQVVAVHPEEAATIRARYGP
jgi:hypothetical protein